MTTHRSIQPSERRPKRPAWARHVACGLAVAFAMHGGAEEPRPLDAPPEVARLDEGVTPATLERAAPGAVPLPLAPGGSSAVRSPRPFADWKLLAALGVAFGVLAAVRFLPRRAAAALPPDVFEVLGEASLGGPHAVRVVRFGPRTLLVGVSAAGCQTLAEISDPAATERVVAACHGGPLAARRGRAASGRRTRAVEAATVAAPAGEHA